MKRLIYGMMVVLITDISCEKNDIKGYNEAPRLEFFNTKAECVFDDRDYINEVTERALGVKVRCLGYALEKPLNFCLKTVDQDPINLFFGFNQNFLLGLKLLRPSWLYPVPLGSVPS